MIGFLDSGVGGLSVLNSCKNILQNQNVVYFCDSKNMPYGNKTKKQIIKIVIKSAKILINKGCEIIIIACNTATACAISDLRKKFTKTIFIGTEPNIKTPVKLGYKKIAVLATPATVKFSKHLQEFKKCDKVEMFSLSHMAKSIEDEETNFSKHFEKIDTNKFDAVVLGCTHYVFAKKNLKKIFKNAVFFDSGDGVAKRLKSYLGKIEFIGGSDGFEYKAKKLMKYLTKK